MSDPTVTSPQSSRPRGRRARRLSEEEQAGATPFIDPQTAPVPRARGAVAPPTADAPLPQLRRFGRRARIIELIDYPEQSDPTAETADPAAGTVPAAPSGDDSTITWQERDTAPSTRADAVEVPLLPEPAGPAAQPEGAQTVAPASTFPGSAGSPAMPAPPVSGSRADAPIVRDADGVELGEMERSDAPTPRPAPRFDGRVLDRRENGRGRTLLWVVWLLVALAVIGLVILLATGVIGGGGAPASLAVALPWMMGARTLPVRWSAADAENAHREDEEQLA